AGHPRSDVPENAACAGATAWIWSCQTHLAKQTGCAHPERGHGVHLAVATPATGLDCLGVGRFGEQPKGPVLLDHETWREKAGGRNRKLGTDLRGHWARFAPGRTETIMISWILRIFSKVSGLFRQREANREFSDEIDAHLDLLAERFVLKGMTR